jgi:hypothetical protein
LGFTALNRQNQIASTTQIDNRLSKARPLSSAAKLLANEARVTAKIAKLPALFALPHRDPRISLISRA